MNRGAETLYETKPSEVSFSIKLGARTQRRGWHLKPDTWNLKPNSHGNLSKQQAWFAPAGYAIFTTVAERFLDMHQRIWAAGTGNHRRIKRKLVE
jgi:hypothetical protein